MSWSDAIHDNFFTELGDNVVVLDKYIIMLTVGIILLMAGALMHTAQGKVNFFGVQMNSLLPTSWVQIVLVGAGGFMMLYGAVLMRNAIGKGNDGGDGDE